MRFVVEEVPFGNKVVRGGAYPVVGVGESFDAGADNRVVFEKFQGACPNDFTDVT